MILPILVSVPHAGLSMPPELSGYSTLSAKDIADDIDEGAAAVYDIGNEVAGFVTTEIARTFVDVNRDENDMTPDGAIKNATCYNVPVYGGPLPDDLILDLLRKYHRPYHEKLSRLAAGMKAGVDCHTMAEKGPPVSPDPGMRRPDICISNNGNTCPDRWLKELAECVRKNFGAEPSINLPFRGGHIIRYHSREIPWVQLELNRAPFFDDMEKRDRVVAALKMWSEAI